MTFYKLIEGGYILSIGWTVGYSENEITEAEYGEILSAIRAKPPATENADYRLREDLTWEEYPVDPPDPDPDIDEAEAFEIIFGGAE